MATDIKKFLDQQGVSTLWGKVVAKVDASVKAEADRALAAEKVNADAIKALDTKVGALPEGSANVIAYVNKKTEGIATDAALSELQESVRLLGVDVDTIEADYLTSVDEKAIKALITAEASRADAAEKANAAAIKAVADDYLKAADKTELSGAISAVDGKVDGVIDDYLKSADKKELSDAIALKADQTALNDVKATAEAAATKAEFDAAVEALEAEDERIAGLVATEKSRAEGVEASLQTQINTIMSNPDAEGAINSINEFTQYVKEHGEIADGFRTDINKNKDDIAAMDTAYKAADVTLQGNIDVLSGVVATKAATADLTALDGRVSTAEGKIADIEAVLGDGEGSVSDQIADAVATEKSRAEGAESALSGRIDTLEAIDHDAYVGADAALKTEIMTEVNKKADTTYVNEELAKKATNSALAEVKATANAAATKTYVDTELGKKAAQSDLEAEVTARQNAVQANANAIAAIKDHASVDSFADVMTEIAKKQDTIPANTYDRHGAAAQALVDAKKYSDDNYALIQSLTTVDIENAIAEATV